MAQGQEIVLDLVFSGSVFVRLFICGERFMTSTETIFKELFAGVMEMSDPAVWTMFAIGGILIWLGVKRIMSRCSSFLWGWAVYWQIYRGILPLSRQEAGSRAFCRFFMKRELPMSCFLS